MQLRAKVLVNVSAQHHNIHKHVDILSYISSDDLTSGKYKELSSIPNWRKTLSNFYQRTPASPLFILVISPHSSFIHLFF